MTQKTDITTGNLVNDAVYDKDGKLERTVGLKLVDTFIYPVVNNFGVFAISVGATYLTSYGDEVGGEFGKFMKWRGDELIKTFESWGWSHNTADMAKMVTFSFLDGCLLSPFVKIMEDNRENMAKQIDTWLGTKPEDESVYTAEPKQSWLSVLGGRLITAGIVVPTAALLSKEFGQKQSINEIVFGGGGKWISEQAKQHFGDQYNALAGKLGNKGEQKLEGLFKTGVFEAFYTSVCTAGLYVSSRFIAGLGGEKEQQNLQTEQQAHDVLQPQASNNIVPFTKVQPDKEQSITVERLQELTLTPQHIG